MDCHEKFCFMPMPSNKGADYMSLVMRKLAFCICENKEADQLRSDRQADQRLCFRYIDSTKIRNFKFLAIFCDCTARFVSDLVGNPEDRFSQNEAHIVAANSDQQCCCLPRLYYTASLYPKYQDLLGSEAEHATLYYLVRNLKS